MIRPDANLISVEEALSKILKQISPVDTEQLPIAQGLNRILAKRIVSDVNVPPFDNSAMDGYAIIATDSQSASYEKPARLKVIENIQAGVAPTKRVVSQTSARIMTGAPVPDGADAVIRFEETSEYDNFVKDDVLLYQPVNEGDNIRFAGEDVQTGQIVLEAGHQLRPQDIGIIAAIGQANVSVYRRPRVAVLATGDELVEINEPISPGKIRNSNEYTQAAMVTKYGGEPVRVGIARDTVEDLTAKINQGLAQKVDLFLTSAGVSVGDFDVVKHVLATEGKMTFWQVNVKPGKPLAFGMLPNQTPLIGLPGNPVAAMIAFEVFARPAILKLAGHLSWTKQTLRATLDEDVFNSGRRHYMRASVRLAEDGYRVTTRESGVRVQGSGILTSMVWANCLVVVPEDVTQILAGTPVDVWLMN
jgi:molybdopterin molybdotransferase